MIAAIPVLSPPETSRCRLRLSEDGEDVVLEWLVSQPARHTHATGTKMRNNVKLKLAIQPVTSPHACESGEVKTLSSRHALCRTVDQSSAWLPMLTPRLTGWPPVKLPCVKPGSATPVQPLVRQTTPGPSCSVLRKPTALGVSQFSVDRKSRRSLV